MAHSPYGLDVDGAGRVYVADYGSATVRIFDPDGGLLSTLFGVVGEADGQFEGLSDVAVDDTRGLLYVTDNLNSRVQQFRLVLEASGAVTAAHTQTFGGYGRGPGQFAYPQNAAVDEATGQLYVSDLGNRRVQVFDPEGRHALDMRVPPGVDDWQVMGLDVDAQGAVYVTDAFNNVIWIFEPDGRLRQKVELR
jgi:DNA-binding beta-propeller fold protein YncE